MSIQIINNSTTLTINNSGNTRTINKSLIREVSILKNNYLKIDIGGGALRNIFLPIAEITAPDAASPALKLQAINTMLIPEDVAILNDLGALSNTVNSIQLKLAGMMPATLQQPILIDDSNPHVIYSGFATIGTDTKTPQWAIMRTIMDGEVQRNQWVNNHQEANYSWDSRFDYSYE